MNIWSLLIICLQNLPSTEDLYHKMRISVECLPRASLLPDDRVCDNLPLRVVMVFSCLLVLHRNSFVTRSLYLICEIVDVLLSHLIQ